MIVSLPGSRKAAEDTRSTHSMKCCWEAVTIWLHIHLSQSPYLLGNFLLLHYAMLLLPAPLPGIEVKNWLALDKLVRIDAL